MASWGGSLIDTDRLRREKGVISVAFELIVGSVDSKRQRGRAEPRHTTPPHAQQVAEPDVPEAHPAEEESAWETGFADEGYEVQDPSHEYSSRAADVSEHYPYYSSPEPAVPFYIPPPEVPDEAGLTEKDRIRQAEQRLLPSQPTDAPDASGPSQPFPEGANIYDADDQAHAGQSQALDDPSGGQQEPPEEPSAPTLDDLAGPAGEPSTIDKQELERQRLLAEASAPPDFPEDYDQGPGIGSSSHTGGHAAPPADAEPSAPTLDDDDEYGPPYAYGAAGTQSSAVIEPPGPAEPLPRYER